MLKSFVQNLQHSGITRGAVISKGSSKNVSHPSLSNFLKAVSENTNDDQHAAVFIKPTTCYGHLMGAFIHRVNRGPGQGGLRHWNYDTLDDFISDGLRLSRGMSQKSALSNLWWGGGKGILTSHISPHLFDALSNEEKIAHRQRIFQEYGEFMSELKGLYYTAEDVGTITQDMDNVFSKTRFVTCISQSYGGSGNPSDYTARGVVSAIQHMTHKLQNRGIMPGTPSFAIQGLGNVGLPVFQGIINSDISIGRIVATDISPVRIERARKWLEEAQHKSYHPNLSKIDIKHVSVENANDVLREDVEIIVPCALGGIIDTNFVETKMSSSVRMICGAANNQLSDDKVADLLVNRNIVYCTDYIVNRMGIVNCANEVYGSLQNDREKLKHFDPKIEFSIPNLLDRLDDESKNTGLSMVKLSHKLAETKIKEKHPTMGDRFNMIIDEVFETFSKHSTGF